MANEPSYWSQLEFVDKRRAFPQLHADEYEDEELLKLQKLIDSRDIGLALIGERYTVGKALFTELKTRIEDNCRRHPYTSAKQEATRMKWARDDRDSPNHAFQMSAYYRLHEGERGYPPVPSVRSITVKKIVVVRNQQLWDKYQQARLGMAARTEATESKLRSVGSTLATGRSQAGTQFDGFPIIDRAIGETLLFHGTDKKAFIVETNIDPSRGRNKAATGATPNYGLLGQGAYFSDQIAKSATYTLCRLCKGFTCGCTGKDGQTPVLRVTLLARVVLGRVHHAPTLSVVLDREHLRRQAHTDPVKNDSNSILAAGSGFKKAAGTNEIAIRNIHQIYPEFIVYWHHDATDPFNQPWDRASNIAMEERREHRAFNATTADIWAFLNGL